MDREIAINNIVLNPAHAVDKASLTTTPASSGDDTTTTLSVDALAEVPLVQSKKSDKTKGKNVASSTSKAKRAHEGTEVKGPRKKSSQGPPLATVTKFEETIALVIHTPESSKVSRESSQSLPNYPWTKEGFKLSESRKDLFKLSQEIQKVTLPLTNLMLSDPRIGKFFFAEPFCLEVWTLTHTPMLEVTLSEWKIQLAKLVPSFPGK